ncbi:MAG: MFS transporter [Candidatus Methanoplasma sp.]|jgi:EmrB/QacA subfamily drug resistance transporter|nr:MFS transporter [Candidatus Methanoplasma sp.]
MSNETSGMHWSNIDRKTRASIMIGLSLGMFIACLDGTVVATAINAIMIDFNGYGEYSWVFTGFMLCETIMIPLAGKLSDQYGRKPLFLIGLTVFLLGSVLCGISGNMTQLIAFRAIQGVGGGILIPVATATVADLYSPAERGKIQGMLGAVFAVAMCIGPFVGGFLTDNVSWHWVFFVNLPIGAVALLLAAKKFPKPVLQDKVNVDYLGMAFLSAFLLVLLLFFTWVGVDFAWLSVETVVMVATAVALIAAFIFTEIRAKDAVIRPSLFRNKMFICCAVTMLIFGIGLMGVMTYMAVFMQAVVGISATNTGMILLPLVAGMMITSLLSGFTVRRTGYRPWLIAGPIITAISMVLLSTLGRGSDEATAIFFLFISGVGFGCVMSVVMIAAQNSAKFDEMGMTTSTVNLFRSVGSTVAVGIFTTIINGRIAKELAERLPSDIFGMVPHSTSVMNILSDPSKWSAELYAAVSGLPGGVPEFVNMILDSYGGGVTFAFLCSAFVVLLVLATAFFMKGKPPEEMDLPENLVNSEEGANEALSQTNWGPEGLAYSEEGVNDGQ